MSGIVGWPVWLGVVADDFEEQRSFYRDTLGFEELSAGPGWVFFDLGWPRLFEVLARDNAPGSDRAGFQVAFEVGDIGDAHDELIARGVDPITPIAGGPESGGWWVYFRDPEGNPFAVTQRLGPPWPGAGREA